MSRHIPDKTLQQEVRLNGMLMRDGGNVELVDVKDDGTVSVKLQGACQG